jgi:hypothetical protein
MAGQPPPGAEDDFLEHFFSMPSSFPAGQGAAAAPGDHHPFPLALSLDAAAEASGGARAVSSLTLSLESAGRGCKWRDLEGD